MSTDSVLFCRGTGTISTLKSSRNSSRPLRRKLNAKRLLTRNLTPSVKTMPTWPCSFKPYTMGAENLPGRRASQLPKARFLQAHKSEVIRTQLSESECNDFPTQPDVQTLLHIADRIIISSPHGTFQTARAKNVCAH